GAVVSGLAYDVARALVVARAPVARRAQGARGRPLVERDLHDQLRFDPHRIGEAGRADEGRRRTLLWSQLRLQPVAFGAVDAGADAAREPQYRATVLHVVVADQQ